MASIRFDRIGKTFGDGGVALEEFSLEVADGELVVLVGPSGSGKSTALRVLAGLEEPTEGSVRIGDRVVDDLPPKDRDLAMVFQSYALYPHMSVADNLAFPLRMRNEPAVAIDERIKRTAGLLGISDLLQRRPSQLSGGQRQRVALGRAVIREPAAFLMDEPLSNLDATLRVEMRAYIARLQERLGTTTLYVTHDQVEAMTMGDRVAVLRDGRIEQVDRPQALYDRPANAFVAGFIGSPSMNLIRCRLRRPDGEPALELGSHLLQLPERAAPGALGGEPDGAELLLGVRPEALRVADGAERAPVIEGAVLLTESLGSDVLVHLGLAPEAAAPNGELQPIEAADTTESRERAAERAVGARLLARLPLAAAPAAGERCRLAVEPEAIHLFHAEHGGALPR
jgi:multiple sugar transport system ATP-binding protein